MFLPNVTNRFALLLAISPVPLLLSFAVFVFFFFFLFLTFEVSASKLPRGLGVELGPADLGGSSFSRRFKPSF